MPNGLITEEKARKTLKKTSSTITKRIGWITILGISVVYLMWGFFAPVFKDLTLIELFLSSAVSMVIALSISNMMGLQGTMSGSLDEDVIALKHDHIDTVIQANEYVEWADEWSDEENKIALRSARKHVLMSAGLKYSTYFNEDGDFLDVELEVPDKDASKLVKQRYNKKVKGLTKALSFKVTPVTMAKISAETTVDLDPNKLDKEPEEYRKAKILNSIWQKVLSVAVFGKVTWALIDGNFFQSLFNGAIQLGVFMLFGAISYYASYTYMTNTYLGNLRKKINLLKRLISYGKKQKLLESQQVIVTVTEVEKDVNESRGISSTTKEPSGTTSSGAVNTEPVLV